MIKLAFTRKPEFHGKVHSKSGISVQFYESNEGKDMLKVTSDSPRQVIEVPVDTVNKALESQWDRDAQERARRVSTKLTQVSIADVDQAQQFQNKADG